MISWVPLKNGEARSLRDIPTCLFPDFRETILKEVNEGRRLACLCVDRELQGYAVLIDDSEREIRLLRTQFLDHAFKSLTPGCNQAHLFEREIAEQYGLKPSGHPWFKPVRYHRSYRLGQDAWARKASQEIAPAVTDFYQVEGEEIHEVAVGPVHAGVIEPGHFRFQCEGEIVHHLEIALGYQHRGIERALVGGPHPLSLKMMETAAGDTTIGHAWAYCQALEALSGITISRRASLIRALALELERLANHTGDLGALAGDVAFLPTASFCGRLRGDWLNMTALICGSRLGRDLLLPGGVRFDLEPIRIQNLKKQLERTARDTIQAVALMFETSSVLERFEEVGRLTPAHCRELGLVGVAARACGTMRDVRTDHVFGPYGEFLLSLSSEKSGDVLARAMVRQEEIRTSVDFCRWALSELQETQASVRQTLPNPAPEQVVVSLVEGWRGEILHLAVTDEQGGFSLYKLVDPSFHNWSGLALALRGEQISDFPLCNKSFNLSYCGFDL